MQSKRDGKEQQNININTKRQKWRETDFLPSLMMQGLFTTAAGHQRAVEALRCKYQTLPYLLHVKTAAKTTVNVYILIFKSQL